MLRVAFALLACRLLLALALIPPWQQPDEPTHVGRVLVHRSQVALRERSSDPGRQAEILRSMAAHRWWEHRGRGFRAPVEIPTSFGQVPQRVGGPIEFPAEVPVYIRAAGRFLSWLPSLSTERELYVLRLASAALALLTLAVAWLAARECLGTLGTAAVALLLALHPHFAIFSTAASPDPVIVLLGACVWWQAVVAVRRERPMAVAAMWAAAIAAAATDRVGVPLIATAFAASMVTAARRVWRVGWSPAWALGATVAGGLLLGAAAWATVAFGETYALSQIYRGGWAPVPGAMSWDRFVGFNRFLHQSWWYSIGWGRYAPPEWWIATAAVVATAAFLGFWRLLIHATPRGVCSRTVLALAATSIAIQLIAVYWIFFRLGIGAQGRYLFPFLVPSITILWAGVDAWAPRAQRASVTAFLIMVFALLDATGWILVAVPAYYASF